jgi:hypothetical protein
VGQEKNRMIEEDEKRMESHDRKMKGYEKKIINTEGHVPMYCPGCGYALSSRDLEKDNCPHEYCGFSFKDKEGDRKF